MKGPFLVLWVLAPIVLISLMIEQGGLGVLLTPSGALVAFFGFSWIMFALKGWDDLFKRLMPVYFFIALAALIYLGLRSAYCGSLGFGTQQCAEIQRR